MEGGRGLEPSLDPRFTSSDNRLARDSIPESAVLAVDSGLDITWSKIVDSLKDNQITFYDWFKKKCNFWKHKTNKALFLLCSKHIMKYIK